MRDITQIIKFYKLNPKDFLYVSKGRDFIRVKEIKSNRIIDLRY